MSNNDIIRRLRYIFDFSDSQMIAIFALAELTVTREQVSNWLKKDDQETYERCRDVELATFLNGFIVEMRGKKKDGPPMIPEQRLTHNLTFRKLKIALNLQSQDIIDILKSAEFELSQHELSSFFRKPGSQKYRPCQDQIMRNFLQGLQIKYRSEVEKKESSPE